MKQLVKKQFVIPSVIESHNSELRNVATDLLHGLKLHDDGTGYIIGQLALSEGRAPHKAINSFPHDLDYQLLLKAGLLIASTVVDGPMTLTLGFPSSTFQVNRDAATELLAKPLDIEYETGPFGGDGIKKAKVKVSQVEVVPEVVGCNLGARLGDRGQRGNVFLVSLGYGTFEACLSTEAGIVQRTLVDAPGIRYAVELAMREMAQEHYLGLRTEHQFDAAFQRGSIIISRRRINLQEARRRALERYYTDVISATLRNAWTDEDFERSDALLLAGGGAHYQDLVDCFAQEFDQLLDIEVVRNPATLASEGYCYRSIALNQGRGGAVGLDIGNAHTVVTVAEEQKEAAPAPEVALEEAEAEVGGNGGVGTSWRRLSDDAG